MHRVVRYAAVVATAGIGIGSSALAAPSASARSVAAAAGVTCPNKVEPLSNGLSLAWTKNQVTRRFGLPTQSDWVGDLYYPDFSLGIDNVSLHISDIVINKGVKLASGVGVGSTPQKVQAVFGSPTGGVTGQYRVSFDYSTNNLVGQITINPAAGAASFAACRAAAASKSGATKTKKPARPSASKVMLVGRWHGILGTPGLLVLRPNHTYTYSIGGAGGRWRPVAGGVVFTGTLAAWNHGRASTARGVLEFHWKASASTSNWFVFQKL